MQPRRKTPETPKIPARPAFSIGTGEGTGNPMQREREREVRRWLLSQGPPCPSQQPTWVSTERTAITGLLGTSRKGDKLAAEGGVGTEAPVL